MTRTIVPRNAERKAVALAAQCRTQGGVRGQGSITDISAQGCCVTSRSVFFQIGSHVMIKPEGLEGLTGIVRWIEGDRAGVEFDTPIYTPVVEHLVQRHGNGAPVGLGTY
ncbi:MAG TPA: PilZ domain-containing protein [Novosphingobium sp.]|nr:PilZ domain-containing protein [Novosphingobium sp.]